MSENPVVGFTVQTHAFTTGEERKIPFLGNSFTILSATGSFKVGLNDGPRQAFYQGLRFDAPAGQFWNTMEIENTSGGALSVEVAIALGSITDARLNVSGQIETLERQQTSLTSAAVSVGTAATAIVASPTVSSRSVTVTNNGSTVIFIGGAGVTTATGTPLPPGASYTVENYKAALYGVVASGTGDARYLEFSS